MGLWFGSYQIQTQQWLRWWDSEGNSLLTTGEEQAGAGTPTGTSAGPSSRSTTATETAIGGILAAYWRSIRIGFEPWWWLYFLRRGKEGEG